jgi:hypothetical protein
MEIMLTFSLSLPLSTYIFIIVNIEVCVVVQFIKHVTITGEAIVDIKELASLMSMLLNSRQTFCSNSDPKLSNVGESIAVSRPRA